MPSIREILVRRLSLVAGGTCLVAALGLSAAYYAGLIVEQYVVAISEVGRLTSMVERQGETLSLSARPSLFDADYAPGSSAGFYQIWDDHGRVIAKSASLGAGSLPRPKAAGTQTAAAGPDEVEGAELEMLDITVPGGAAGGLCYVRWDPMRGAGPMQVGEPDNRAIVAVARPTWPLHRRLITAASVLFGIALGATLLLRAVIAMTVRRGLRPLSTLAEQVSHIDESRFAARFDPLGLPTETAPFATAINGLLERVEGAVERERRFSANAAHELRTPLAEIRTVADVARRVGTPEAHRAALDDVLAVSQQTERVLSALLRLSRRELADGSQTQAAADVAGLVRSSVARLHARLTAKNLSCSVAAQTPCLRMADESLLATIIGNLLDNAAEYSAPGGRIDVALQSEDGRVTLQVRNGPVDLEESDLARMTEPFWRKSQTRGSGDHSGLGMSIVAALVDDLGGTMRTALAGDKSFEVVVTLPLAVVTPS